MSTRRRYGPDDARTAAQRREDAEHRRVAILAVMEWTVDTVDRVEDTPNGIALAAQREHGMPLHRPYGHNGALLGPGSAIAGVFTSMRKRGLIGHCQRRDGLTGGGYRITAAGRQHLHEHRHLLDTPWHDTADKRGT